MKIGARKIVHTATLIVPKNERAVVEFSVGDWHIELHIVFVTDKLDSNDGAMSIEVIDGKPHLKLSNWKNSLGTATVRPVELGRTREGEPLTFMLSHWLIGEAQKLDIQFLLGENDCASD